MTIFQTHLSLLSTKQYLMLCQREWWARPRLSHCIKFFIFLITMTKTPGTMTQNSYPSTWPFKGKRIRKFGFEFFVWFLLV